MLTPEQESFALALTRECKPEEREKWISIMAFGMGTLLQSPDFLMELIVDRARVEHQAKVSPGSRTLGETAAFIARDLGLYVAKREPELSHS